MKLHFLYTHWTGCPRCNFPGTQGVQPQGLYEGRSVSPGRRTGQHADAKSYWPKVRIIQVEPMWGLSSRQVAEEERRRINLHRYPFNRTHNPAWERLAIERAQIAGQVRPSDVAVELVGWARWVRKWSWVPAVWVTSVVVAVVGLRVLFAI